MSATMAHHPRRIVIVGGVAAGMSAAARARRLDEDAEIVVLERSEHVSFANCGLPYYVGGEIQDEAALLVQTPERLRDALDLDVRVRHDVIALDPARRAVAVRGPQGEEQLRYDALILAPGAAAVRPPLPGLDSPRVSTLRTVEDAVRLRARIDAQASSPARRAVVLGAGFIGLEAAEALRRQGLEVDLVELAPHVLPPLEPETAAPVTAELQRLGISVHAGIAAQAVEQHERHDTLVLADGRRLEADLILLSVGIRPDTAVFEAAGVACERGAILVDEHGRTNLPDVYAAGDAVLSVDAVTGLRRTVALAGPANRAGRGIADHIIRPASARPLPAPVGTAILRVGEITAALTGANADALRASGIETDTLHLHPTQHAGYFPGATPLSLVVHIRRGDGLLLGAQAVGREGVDKRIDVLATAIRSGLTAAELIDLDLAYSPIYGSAKDPVNLVGMVGTNVTDGTLVLWYAQDWGRLRDETLILDVRSAAEFAAGHLPGALNIPHTELRDRLDEVRAAAAGRPVRVLCGSGVRSHIAHRLLTQSGFDSASLSGGMLTARAVLGDDVLVT
ncbi:NADPH-dependent 2,4-dienoyl-CoA reductase, sulfur reductase [Microbacterium azadirachtae]|uniref:NADPH-dependent 2,4-dienoyl-CoA reductase, sulfur reductase n=1 Tax=Microbacterium azadirachtae TaxID=582680 RepID=A0A1I6HDT5_9MICO|nr:FAD-dependent oxidoreductase [Microbacterium azadirachtae]SFR52619.1 NADPH-dependent 2,4-dienoyl-CoA reductase, sulfur reductase [Microbacterium azadirachtae]